MATGTMKKAVEGKDFRFIKPDQGDKDLFSHKDSYVGVNMNELNEGDKVSYDEEASDRGPRAVNIQRA
jgi:CspA family cold shock protein